MAKHPDIHSDTQPIISKDNPQQKKTSEKAFLHHSSSEVKLGADMADTQTEKLLNLFSGFELL